MTKYCAFLLEISCEEIPARMQVKGCAQWKDLFFKNLIENGIDVHSIDTFITPRRLIVKADLSTATKEINEEKRGPKENAPEKALDGFLKAQDITKQQLFVKDGYYYALIKQPAIESELLLPKIIDAVLTQMTWPKVMRYPQSKIPWVRPIRNIMCLYNNKPLKITIDALGMTTTDFTIAHRFQSPQIKAVTSFDEYKSFLNEHHVIISHDDRQNIIEENLKQLADMHNLEWIVDPNLLEEVAGLVEFPFPFMGNIDQKFMHLPECVLITSMKVHQKYFVFRCKKTKKLAPYFCVVANHKPESLTLMMANYEKVLKARLSDALFFYETDLKNPLAYKNDRLKNITYHHKLGSLQDKLNRLNKNSFFEHDDKLTQAINLSKSDLLSDMVGEFPELQGKMGSVYAKKQGLDDDIAIALEDYYKPQGPDDGLPSNNIASKLSILDKMDALVGFLGFDLKPTGSKDPFALRRQALGVIRILLTDAYKSVDVDHLIDCVIKTYGNIEFNKDTKIIVKDFMIERFSGLMQNIAQKDVVAAIIQASTVHVSLWQLEQRIKALQSVMQTEKGDLLKQLYKRALGVCKDMEIIENLNPDLFEHEAEHVFWKSIQDSEKNISYALSQDNFDSVMTSIVEIQPSVTLFFDNVMVNVDNKNIQNNRKKLVYYFLNQIKSICHLEHIS